MRAAALLIFALCAAGAGAQSTRTLGSVSTRDADVVSGKGGTLEVSGGRAVLIGNSTVTAKDHTATVSLARGGEVRVCQSSGLHVTDASGTDASGNALLLALDRGALELKLKVTAHDVLMTPDLRFTPASDGALDLQVRVTRNGDTCVDNRGRKAPLLNVADAFGQTAYQLKPGQHVFFEHGSLREVVDRETTPCGCPPDEHAVPLAEAMLRGGASGKPVTPEQAAATHPFPAAISEGLAEPAPREPEKDGETHIQVSQTLNYDPSKPAPVDVASAAPAGQPAPVIAPAQQQKPGAFHAIGSVFRRLFVR